MIEYSDNFLKEAKKLSKKYKFLKTDLKQTVNEITTNQDLGVYLGFDLYKKRVKNSSIPTEKNGGFRIIIYKQLEEKIILILIYSKPDKETLSDEELSELVNFHFNQ